MKTPKKHGSGSRLPTDVDRLVGDNVRRLRTQREDRVPASGVARHWPDGIGQAELISSPVPQAS
jgi:hypothetical protein